MAHPRALSRGDIIGIVAPSSPFAEGRFEAGCNRLQNAGFRTTFREDIRSSEGYLAGDDRRRAVELQDMLDDEPVKAIFCARGGFGATRILPLLEPKAFEQYPKILVGFSDITALHAFYNQLNLPTIHGPLVTTLADEPDDSFEHLLRLLTEPGPPGPLGPHRARTVKKGVARGEFIGGNLSLLCNLIGTPYFPDTAGKILFIEEASEAPYRIDRMLTQLLQAGVLDGVAGLVVGRLFDCVPRDARLPSPTAEEVVLERVSRLGCPVIVDFPAGHGAPNYALPFGTKVVIDGNQGLLIGEESLYRR